MKGTTGALSYIALGLALFGYFGLLYMATLFLSL